MAKYRKTILAGPLVAVTVYPAISPRDPESVRAGKKRQSSEAQKRINSKHSFQKLKYKIAANFAPGDLFVTLTYDDAHLPRSRPEALANLKRFWRGWRKAMGPPRYIVVTEHKHGLARWHHHVILGASGNDIAALTRLWEYGGVDVETIRVDRTHSYENLARYLCKERPDKLGLRGWSCSRGLRSPVSLCERVPNDTPLAPPSGAHVLFDTGDVSTIYGHYRAMEYMHPKWNLSPKKRAKRRKKRRSGKTQ